MVSTNTLFTEVYFGLHRTIPDAENAARAAVACPIMEEEGWGPVFTCLERSASRHDCEYGWYLAKHSNTYFYHSLCVACYCMSAMAIHQILESNPRAAGPRASANIMTYSPRTNVITCLLYDHQCQYIVLHILTSISTHINT